MRTQPDFAPSPTLVDPAEPVTAASTTATLSADFLSERRTFDPRDLLKASQGGYEPMSNLNWFAGQTAQLSSIGMTEVRIDHVLSNNFYDIVQVGADGTIGYDFSRLDQVTQPLVKAGIQPLLVLAYAPAAAPDPVWGPESLAVWSGAVEALVAHHRDLGQSGWAYEVWNEIDTHSWHGTLADYEALYTASALAVKKADPTALVGGAAASDLNSPGAWSTGFINFLGENPDVPADFFSVHSYRSAAWETVPQARELLDGVGRTELPIYITEWNNKSVMDGGAGSGSDTNSSVNGSSYVAKRLALAIDSGADKFYYFSPVEGFSHTLPYNGDLGLVTVDGHRKSVANVFEMFSKLQPSILDTSVDGYGSGSSDITGLVTADAASKEATVLLWNNTADNAVMTVSLANLPYPETNFRVEEQVVSGTKGNGFADTSTFVHPSYPSPNENAPVTRDFVLEGSATFAEDVLVPANGVVTLSFEPTSEPVGDIVRSAQPAAVNLAAAASGAVAAASSSIELPTDGWTVANVNDGRRHSFERSDPMHGWSSASHPKEEGAEQLVVDLGAAKPVDSVVLWPRDSQTYDGSGFPTGFTIDGSTDGEDWATVYETSDYNDGETVSGPQTFFFEAAEYRYLRVNATTLTSEAGNPTAHVFQLAEIEAYRNGIPNGGFETGDVDGWTTSGSVKAQRSVVRTGNHGVVVSKADSAITTVLGGLKPNTTYTFGGHAKLSSAKAAATISASQFGGKRVESRFDSTNWSAGWVTFTTGEDDTSATLEFTLETGGKAWADDFVLTQQG